MTPAQSRAARGLLDWSQSDLAQSANVGLSTLKNFEGGRSAPMANNLTAMKAALETAGVIFVAENGEGPGVRLKKGFIPTAPRKASSAADVVASAKAVRSRAAGAADDAMKEVDASSGQKAGRREALTDEPAMVEKARGKSDANR